MRTHLCLLHLDCWKDWWEYGMPMRLYIWVGPDRREIILPVWPLNDWRHNRVWGDAEPVDIVEGPNG